MGKRAIKIHNVMHNEKPESIDKSKISNSLESSLTRKKGINNIRIAWGYQNSPIFIYLSEDYNISLSTAKRFSRFVVKDFSRHVAGVNVDKTVRDDNILFVSDG